MSHRGRLNILFAFSWFVASVAGAQTAATVTIQAGQPGAVVSSNLFGIFFEEINFAGEGGIYAEMVRNRAFYSATNATYWTLVTQGTGVGTMAVDASQPLNASLPNSLKLTKQAGTGTVGAGNAGFWGMSLQAGASYDLSFYVVATNGFAGPLGARLESADGSRLYAQAAFGNLTTNWQRLSGTLVASGSDTNARLVLSLANNGTVWLDLISLFPHATFHNRTNGLRLDLANLLAALQPSFLRFPGGNFIEANNLTNSVRWKTTIGDLALRPGHFNDAWGYWSTDGFGYHEFLQYCEDMGMEPLYGINAGLALGYNGSTNNTVPLAQLGPWVQDALDAIQYANGDTNTTWGALRAANGHPAPFHLKFMEIGNENGGAYYDPRYAVFYDAIKSNYPTMHLISPVWGSPSIPTSRPVEIMDEHYYSSPATFISYATKYDNYSRSGPKVFVGEYAVTTGYGTYGNLAAALGEAAFMTGMERNSDLVQMASYAPLFANVNGIQWAPDLIYYDSGRAVFGTPSYYVQELFSQNRGEAVLPATIALATNAAASTLHGGIGLGSWNTSVQYTNLVVTSNGVTLYQSDFVNQGTNGWRVFNGTWSTNNGCYQQTAQVADCYATAGSTNWANYTISVQARKVAGAEGFLVLFNFLDDNNWTWWNVGGWGNTLDGIEQMAGGGKTILAQAAQTALATNTWYNLRVVLTNGMVQCYLNNTLVQTTAYPSGLVASSTFARAAGQIVVKAVNPYNSPIATTFNITGVSSVATNASLIQLTSASAADENSFAAPTKIFPVTNTLAIAGTNFNLLLPANSLSILRLNASGVTTYTNLLLQIPSPLNSGQLVASTFMGQLAGNTINLTANANHALSWFSANTNIATVDQAGNVTGVASGTTSISVSYASLGLAATQTVQVISVPSALVHRYSFGETTGTNVTDSVGGQPGNGTLPRGGTWSAGQLSLAAAASQYVQLPAGIISNYAAVTVEAWATFPNQLPVNCFFFGFGNSLGTSGTNYIFCAPRAGRIAISGGNYSSEQNAYGNFDFSFHTNFHVTAVFNPPANSVALYTNGVLAGINNSVTTPFTAVNDVYSFVGRSLYSGDPYADFTLDEFRIYKGALSAAEVAATQVLGPNQLLTLASPSVSAIVAGGNLTLTWPVASAGFTVMTTTNLAPANWVPAASAAQINGNQWQINLPVTSAAQYFRLQK